MTLTAKITVICHWEVSLTSIHFRDNNFTMMLFKKKQRSLNADNTDLNVKRKKLEWLKDTVIVIWDLF